MEKWSSAEAKLLAADLAPFVCAWLPPGRCSGYCRHILTERGGRWGGDTASNSTLSIIPQICKFVRFNRSFKSASVLQGFFVVVFFVYGSRKDARIQRKWDSRRFITSVTSLNRQSKQWDPNYKRVAWQYQKKKKKKNPSGRRAKPHSTWHQTVLTWARKMRGEILSWLHSNTNIYNYPYIKNKAQKEKEQSWSKNDSFNI